MPQMVDRGSAIDPLRTLRRADARPTVPARNRCRTMFDAVKIRTQIERTALEEAELPPEQAREVAFHMTDWLDDLQRYVRFCESPESAIPAEVNKMLLAFLIHVP